MPLITKTQSKRSAPKDASPIQKVAYRPLASRFGLATRGSFYFATAVGRAAWTRTGYADRSPLSGACEFLRLTGNESGRLHQCQLIYDRVCKYHDLLRFHHAVCGVVQ